MCQEVVTTCASEVTECVTESVLEYLLCINTGAKYCVECVCPLDECQCTQFVCAPKKLKITVLSKRDFSCKRNLITLLDSPQSGEQKDYATSKRTYRERGKNKEKKIIEKKIIQSLKNRKGKNGSFMKEVLAKRGDKPHAGFTWFGDRNDNIDYSTEESEPAWSASDDPLIYNDAHWAEDSDEHWDYYFFPSVLVKWRYFASNVVRKATNISDCMKSTSSNLSRFSMALILDKMPIDILNRALGADFVRTQRSRHFAEIHLLRFVNFDEVFWRPIRQRCISIYNVMCPSLKNADIWACYLLAVKDSASMQQFLCITYNSARALGFELLSPHIEELFSSVVDTNMFKIKVQSDGYFDFTEFMQFFKKGFDFYSAIKKSVAFTYVVQLFSMLVSHGCCEAIGIQFEMFGIKFFREGFLKSLQKTKPSITDIFDLLANMAEYFVTTGYMCFKHKSFRPLLFDSTIAYDMAQLHVKITSNWNAIKDLAWEITPFLDDCDFREQASKLVAYYKEVYQSLTRVNVHEAVIVKRKWTEIETYMVDLTRLMLCGQLRSAPFGILIHGGSSVGKSTLTSIVTTISIIGQGGNPDFELRKVTNPNDEFFSNYSYGTEAIILDDMCNTKESFTKKSPLEKIVEYINNVPAYPVMADLSSKGKIPLTPKVVVVTTNVEDLQAKVYSNEPVSIMRRFNVIINVQVKPEFAIDPTVLPQNMMIDKEKVSRFVSSLKSQNASEEQITIPDIWNIRMWTVRSTDNKSLGGVAEVMRVPLKPGIGPQECLPMSIYECNEFILQMSSTHKVEQQTVLKTIKSVPAFLSNKYKEEYPHKNYQPHFVDVNAINDKWKKVCRDAQTWTIPGISHLLSWFGLDPLADIRNFCYLALVPFYPIMPYHAYGTGLLWVVGCIYSTFGLMHNRLREFRRAEFQHYKFGTLDGSYLAIACTIKCVIVVYMLRTFWQMVKQQVKVEPQGNLTPLSMEEVKKNSSQVNCWSTTVLEPIQVRAPATSVSADVLEVCKKNLVLFVNGTKFVNAFFVEQNICIVPLHFLKLVHNSGLDLISIVSREKYVDGNVTNNHTQTFVYSQKAWFHIPNTDLCAYYVSNAMPRKSVKDWFPENVLERDIPSQMVVRGPNGALQHHTARLKYGPQDTGAQGCRFNGYSYMLDTGHTFNGMCMGVWVADTKPPCIVGFHLGGLTGSPRGCAGALTRTMVQDASDILFKRLVSAVQCGTEGYINLDFAKNIPNSLPQELEPRIAAKHPAKFLEPGANITVFGTIGPTHKYHTSVVYRQLGVKFLNRFDIPIAHGPPNMNAPPKWYHFSKNMAEFATPVIGPSLDALEWAVLDYMLPIISELKRLGFGMSETIRPLTNQQNVNGVPGVRFLDALKTNTAAGYPLKGKTSEYLTGADGERDFIYPVIWDEVTRMENEYAAGRRCFPVFIAHLKDEPVKLGKDKVRVFFGNGTPFKLIVRKYWLPIARLLSELPILAECAIGVNSHSLEWDQFLEYVEHFGKHRCIAGDYKGYDQKEFLNVTQSCYSIYMRIARVVGYTDEELKIMSAMVPDLTTFMVMYYGALVMMSRGNASGQNMTSYVNSTANSLNSRCAYYDSSPQKPPPPFRKNVHMMTYGDDDIGTVSTSCSWFNAKVKAHYLHLYGIEYTPPDKEGTHELFYNTREVDFLKRKSVYIPQLEHHLGALAYSSVLKSITCGIPTPHLSPSEIFGQILDGALLELFAHGEEVYEEFRGKVNLFITEEHLERFVKTNHLTFFDRCEMWRNKYVRDEPDTGYQVDHTQDLSRLVWEMSIGHFDSGPYEGDGSV